MKDIEVRVIEYGSDEYQKELLLRDEILRKPIGLSLFDENLAGEINDVHIGAFDGTELVGVLILTEADKACMKMRQVAVREDMQGSGIGKKMVEFCEIEAKDKGAARILLHARMSAVEFYLKLGYTRIGEQFTEVGIPHTKMEKQLNK